MELPLARRGLLAPPRWLSGIAPAALLGKELRMQMRNRQSLAIVTAYVAILGAVVVVFMTQRSGELSGRSSHAGATLFTALAVAQLCLVLFVTPPSMAGAVSGERQRQTLDLLRVTRLSPFSILWTKLVAGCVVNVLLLFVSLPLFGVASLFGGVTAGDIPRTYAVLAATVVFLSVITLFVSTLTTRPTAAMILGNLASMGLGFGISLAVLYAETRQEDVGLDVVTQLGALPSDLPPLSPVVQVDPMVALLSALPSGSGGTLLGNLGVVRHAFGTPLRLEEWQAFGVIALAVTAALLALATLLLRTGPPWLREVQP